jgi:hypothetical protein
METEMSKKYLLTTAALFLMAVGIAEANLVANGDFELGNTGFFTAYDYIANGSFPSQYSINTNPHNWAGGYQSFGDHTTGSGNMMLIDAAGGASGGAGRTCWSETITVSTNTDYTFSAWIAQIYLNGLTSNIEFSINGSVIGTYIVPTTTTTWYEFAKDWNSGSVTQATITIRETTGDNSYPGNDFALDDIAFVPEPATIALLGIGGILLRKSRVF